MNNTLKNTEQQLSYFTEDPRLNSFNMYYRAYYPSWYNVTEYGHKIDRRGEQFYYTYQQIYARYMLERLSNGMPNIEPFVYNKPFQVRKRTFVLHRTRRISSSAEKLSASQEGI
jgi:hypothetical protein